MEGNAPRTLRPSSAFRKPPHLGGHQSHATATDGSGRGRRPRHRKEEPHGHTPERMEGNAQRQTFRPSLAFRRPPPLGTPPAEIETAGAHALFRSDLNTARHPVEVEPPPATDDQPETSEGIRATAPEGRATRPRHGTDGRVCTAHPSGLHQYSGDLHRLQEADTPTTARHPVEVEPRTPE